MFQVDFHRYRVTVEVAQPREDWMTRLVDRRKLCPGCDNELGDEFIYVNTEGATLDPSGADKVCSWPCLLRVAASVVIGEAECGPNVSVEEVPDWRGDEHTGDAG